MVAAMPPPAASFKVVRRLRSFTPNDRRENEAARLPFGVQILTRLTYSPTSGKYLSTPLSIGVQTAVLTPISRRALLTQVLQVMNRL